MHQPKARDWQTEACTNEEVTTVTTEIRNKHIVKLAGYPKMGLTPCNIVRIIYCELRLKCLSFFNTLFICYC